MKTLVLLVTLLPMIGCAQYSSYRPSVDTRYPTQQRSYQQGGYQSYQQSYPSYQQNYQQPQTYPYQQNNYPSYQQNYQQPYYQPQSYQQNNYPLDEQECQRLAENSSNFGSQTVQGGLVGALGGAAGGAALGAIIDDPAKGAMIGSVLGIAGAGYGAYNADQQYKSSFNKCMRNRGYNVIN